MYKIKWFLGLSFCVLVILGIRYFEKRNDDIEYSSRQVLEGDKIDISNYDFDSEFYPYYNMLTRGQKELYCQIYSSVYEYRLNIVLQSELTTHKVDETIQAFINDHPEVFWLDNAYSYKYTDNRMCVEVTLQFNETYANIEANRNRFDAEVDHIVEAASAFSTDLEKERYVHNVIIDVAEYDEKTVYSQNAFSALVDRKTVCAGYAKAFQCVMRRLNIPTYYCVGFAKEDHAWNIVRIGESYYNVDLTWDDASWDRYAFFNLSDKELASTHTRRGLSTKLVKCN